MAQSQNAYDCGYAVLMRALGVSRRWIKMNDPEPDAMRGLSIGEMTALVATRVGITPSIAEDMRFSSVLKKPVRLVRRDLHDRIVLIHNARSKRSVGHWIYVDRLGCIFDSDAEADCLPGARYSRGHWLTLAVIRIRRRRGSKERTGSSVRPAGRSSTRTDPAASYR